MRILWVHTLSERSGPALTRGRINLIIACRRAGVLNCIHFISESIFIVILVGCKTWICEVLGAVTLVFDDMHVGMSGTFFVDLTWFLCLVRLRNSENITTIQKRALFPSSEWRIKGYLLTWDRVTQVFTGQLLPSFSFVCSTLTLHSQRKN
jgi:hypothetical protein